MPSIIAKLKRFAQERKIPRDEMIMGHGYDDVGNEIHVDSVTPYDRVVGHLEDWKP